MMLKRLLSLAILAGSIPLLTCCASNKTLIHPITGKDIYVGQNPGDVCFSAEYLEKVLQVKIENQ